jgi:hypothetical protein
MPDLMINGVHNVAGAVQWVPKPQSAPGRETPSSTDTRDEFVASAQYAAVNPYDKDLDRLRAAALRRDAALTAAQRNRRPDGAPDDTAAQPGPRGRGPR